MNNQITKSIYELNMEYLNKSRLASKAYYEKNKEKILIRQKEYRKNNKEQIESYKNKYSELYGKRYYIGKVK
jgi:hypothetical protein